MAGGKTESMTFLWPFLGSAWVTVLLLATMAMESCGVRQDPRKGLQLQYRKQKDGQILRCFEESLLLLAKTIISGQRTDQEKT